MALPSADDAFGAPPDAGVAAGLPKGLWESVKSVESNNNPKAVSPKGASGVSQVMPKTATQPGFGLAPMDPKNPDAGAPYLKKMIDLAGGDISKGVQMYNAGPKGDLSNQETTQYLDKVMKKWKPPAEAVFGPEPADDKMSSLASAPPKAGAAMVAPAPTLKQIQTAQQQQQQQEAQQKAKFEQEHPLIAAINKPADRTVQLMGQDTARLLDDVRQLASKPTLKGAFNTALDAVGLPFSPITSTIKAFASEPVEAVAHDLGLPTKWDPTIDMVVQMAAPVGVMKSKTLQEGLDPIAKFLLGANDAHSQNITMGMQAKNVSDTLNRGEGKIDAVMTQWRKGVDGQLPVNYQDFREDIFHAYDTGDVSKLSPEAAAFKKNVLDPVAKKTARLRDELKTYGVDVGPDQANYITRRPMDKPQGPIFKGLVPKADSFATDVKTPKGLSTGASELKERTNVAVESPSGDRMVAVQEPNTGRSIVYKNGIKVDSGELETLQNGDRVVKTNQGVHYKVSDATVKEIETHTDTKYHKDPVAAVVQANVDMQKALINAKTIEAVKTSPEFMANSRRPDQPAPADFRTVEVPGTRQFDGIKMHPRIAQVLEDYKGTVNGPLVDSLGKVNRLVIGSLFFNPLPHVMNVLTHSFVEKGLVGNVVSGAQEAFRAAMPGMTSTTADAWRAVWNKDANYMKYMNEGAGLMYPSVYTRDFFDQVLKQVGSHPQASNLAKAFGYANPAAWLGAVYNTSRKSLWFANDVIMMQAYLEKERAGFTTAHAIADVEKHVPNYRVPPTVLGSRNISLALRNPAIAAFGRYDYGRMASYGHMLTDLTRSGTGLNAAQRARALDQVAATAFLSFFVYPHMLDKAAAAVTGNPNATYTRYGPATIPTLLYDMYGRGDGDPKKKSFAQGVSTALPSAPVAKIAPELVANRDSFTGQKLIVKPEDLAGYLGKQVAPVALVEQYKAGKTSAKQILLQQFGIKSPTPEQIEKTRKWVEREDKADARRRNK